jgi:hypothetical protein
MTWLVIWLGVALVTCASAVYAGGASARKREAQRLDILRELSKCESSPGDIAWSLHCNKNLPGDPNALALYRVGRHLHAFVREGLVGVRRGTRLVGHNKTPYYYRITPIGRLVLERLDPSMHVPPPNFTPFEDEKACPPSS